MVVRDHLGNFEAVDGVWDTLLSNTASHIFFTPLWARVWWRNLGSGEPHLLKILRQDRPIGMAPMSWSGKTARLLGDKEVCDYLDVVALPGEETAVARELFAFASEHRLSLDLFPLLDDSPVVGHIRALGRGDKLAVLDTSYWLDLPATWDEYFEILPGKDRHELRRKMRRLERSGEVGFGESHAVQADMDEFLRLFRYEPEKTAFLTPARDAFFRDLARDLGDKGWLKLYFLQVGGRRWQLPFALIMVTPSTCITAGSIPRTRTSAWAWFRKRSPSVRPLKRGRRNSISCVGRNPIRRSLEGVP